MTTTIYIGDCREVLGSMAAESVQCVVTSPPYWGLRDYGLPPSVWGGDEDCQHAWDEYNASQGQFCQFCDAWLGCLGLEPTPNLYVEHLVEVFREVWRVLRSDGTLWLNLGDTYSQDTKWGGRSGNKNDNSVAGGYQTCRNLRTNSGLKPKDLVGVPWRVAFALQAAGWWLRRDIVWYKPNCQPESVRDRPTTAHDYVFLLSKSQTYFYDAEAIKEPATGNAHSRGNGVNPKSRKSPSGWDTSKGAHNELVGRYRSKQNPSFSAAVTGLVSSRNKRSVWTIPTHPFPEAHFATFPPALVEPCVEAGTSERGACVECGAGQERIVEKTRTFESGSGKDGPELQSGGETLDIRRGLTISVKTIGWRPICDCYNHLYYSDFPQARSARKRYQRDVTGDWWKRVRKRPGKDHWPTDPAVVLDPFGGAGTVALVAERLGCDAVLIELSVSYVHDIALPRLRGKLGEMFTTIDVIG